NGYRHPPPNQPYWGVHSIMYGLCYKRAGRNNRVIYGFDYRYLLNKRSAKVHGHNNLVPGAWYPLQKSAMFHGAHGAPIKGIYGNATDGVYSIVVSGRNSTYHDLDRDEGDSLVYSADSPTGANADNNVAAQQSADARALRTSIQTRRPVRVLRSAASGRNPDRQWAPSVGIRYDGLYRVMDELQGNNGQGGTVVKFRLRRLGGQTHLATLRDTVPSPQQILDEARIRDLY
ncbi:hypothetical protein N658DRAFT_425980, partial [Parathielavia hyrcaniae]